MQSGSGRGIMVSYVDGDAADGNDGGFEDDVAMLRDHCHIVAGWGGLVHLATGDIHAAAHGQMESCCS